MGHKPKAYVATLESGVLRTLFSVRERGEQGIVIARNFARMEERSGRSDREHAEHHFSIHPSGGGTNTTITEKILYRGGGWRSSAAYLYETRDHLLWPVYSCRQFAFSENSKFLTPRARDRIGVVSEYNQARNTLLYSVFVVLPGFDVNTLKSPGFWAYLVPFHLYSLIVFVSFLHIPAWPIGNLFRLFTSTPRGDDETGEHIQTPGPPFPLDKIEDVQLALAVSHRDEMYERISSELALTPSRLATIDNVMAGIHADPLP